MNASSTKISSRTNWEKVLNKSDEDIDFSDSPELSADAFALSLPFDPHSDELIAPSDAPATVTLEVEPDVLEWFRAQGEESHHKMRAALRIYARAHQ